MNSVRTLFLALFVAAATLPALAQSQYTPPTVTVTNPLSEVHYQYKWELYGGLAYSHFTAGPQLIHGANLGGVDLQATRFFNTKWGLDANYRGYFGGSPVQPNTYEIHNPFVSEQMAVFGPEYRAIANKHASITFHALVGGAYGDFQSAIAPLNTSQAESELGLFPNQWSFASVLGGALDLNRSARWAFRLEPDATLTRFSSPGGSTGIQQQFALSVGIVYRLVPRYESPAVKKARMEKKLQEKQDHHRSLLHPF